MKRILYNIGLHMVFVCWVGVLVCKFFFDSNLYGFHPSDFLAMGLIIYLTILILFGFDTSGGGNYRNVTKNKGESK